MQDVLRAFPKRFDEYERMITDNPVWKARTIGIGKLTTAAGAWAGRHRPDVARFGRGVRLSQGATLQRLRKLRFQGPTSTEGDTYARYLVRLEEMRQSLRIIEQGLKNLPDGPVWTADRKMALPPRQELDTSMEALIHHFKLNTEGFIPPKGEVYECVEGSARRDGLLPGERWHGESLPAALPHAIVRQPAGHEHMAAGGLIADLVVIIGTVDIVLGDVDR